MASSIWAEDRFCLLQSYKNLSYVNMFSSITFKAVVLNNICKVYYGVLSEIQNQCCIFLMVIHCPALFLKYLFLPLIFDITVYHIVKSHMFWIYYSAYYSKHFLSVFSLA